MRLIDADEEIIITKNLGGNTHSCHRTTVADYLNNVMDKIHIVDAVPVEWIRGFADRLRVKGFADFASIMDGMLKSYCADGERKDGERDGRTD